jgi:hypothetical protein
LRSYLNEKVATPVYKTETEHAVAASGVYPSRPNIISDEDFEPSGITHKDEMPGENLEMVEDGNSSIGSPLRVDGPVLPIPASP